MSLERIYNIQLKDVTISDENVRVAEPTKNLEELAASIKRHGLLQPVVLLGEFGKPPYSLISGQRRFLAYQKIRKTKTIAAVFAGNLSKTQAVVRSLVENLQRLDLEYHDSARAITELYKMFGKDEREVQKETGLSIRKIRDFILIDAQATPKMKRLLKERQVSPADVKRALRAAQANLKKAEQLLDLIVKYKPTAHQKRRLVHYGERDKKASAKRIIEEAMKDHVEENIVISIPKELRSALIAATKKLSIEAEELASKIIVEWLRAQGFVK